MNAGTSTHAGTQKFIDFFSSEQVQVVVKQSPTNPKLLNVVSTGRSRDGQAKAVVSREFYFSGNVNNGGNNIPIAPITTNTQTLIEGAVQLDHHREQVLVPLDLTEAETAALLAFLRSLDGPGPEPRWAEPPAR